VRDSVPAQQDAETSIAQDAYRLGYREGYAAASLLVQLTAAEATADLLSDPPEDGR
jgi:hypothetical protein